VSEEVKHEKLSDDNLILTNATVRGYSFTVKKFLEFFVDSCFPLSGISAASMTWSWIVASRRLFRLWSRHIPVNVKLSMIL
jgi:hypothetical protein